MNGHKTIQIRIEGVVQGVGFRGWVRQQAEQLGVSGWVRNLRDGAVEALLSGPEPEVNAMLERCRSGPAAATVEDVQIIAEGGAAPQGFSIKPTT